MKTLNLASFATSLVAVCVLSTPAVTYAAASPDVGVSCPVGFTGQLSGGSFRCTKQVTIDLTNESGRECLVDAPFDNFQKMTNNQRDICVHRDSNIPSNANLAEFENGQVLIAIPVTAQLPRNLAGRQPVKVVNGLRFFRINENADFIFYDRSKTIDQLARAKTKAIEVVTERQLGVPGTDVHATVGQIATTQPDFSGSLDKIEGRVNVTTFARP
jgi:hypothetical protein